MASPADTPSLDSGLPDTAADDNPVHDARRWRDNGWLAQVIKNDDDDGWAVAMYKAGESEPALVGPWTMGRDKKNPKPLDTAAFNTLVKTASEVLRRHEQQLQATLNKQITVGHADARVVVSLCIVPDEDEPYATLSAATESGDALAAVKVRPDFKLNRASATAWVEREFAKPA